VGTTEIAPKERRSAYNDVRGAFPLSFVWPISIGERHWSFGDSNKEEESFLTHHKKEQLQ
jgi:hypothetical protein